MLFGGQSDPPSDANFHACKASAPALSRIAARAKAGQNRAMTPQTAASAERMSPPCSLIQLRMGLGLCGAKSLAAERSCLATWAASSEWVSARDLASQIAWRRVENAPETRLTASSMDA